MVEVSKSFLVVCLGVSGVVVEGLGSFVFTIGLGFLVWLVLISVVGGVLGVLVYVML